MKEGKESISFFVSKISIVLTHINQAWKEESFLHI
jgi:hypothetical protein